MIRRARATSSHQFLAAKHLRRRGIYCASNGCPRLSGCMAEDSGTRHSRKCDLSGSVATDFSGRGAKDLESVKPEDVATRGSHRHAGPRSFLTRFTCGRCGNLAAARPDFFLLTIVVITTNLHRELALRPPSPWKTAFSWPSCKRRYLGQS